MSLDFRVLRVTDENKAALFSMMLNIAKDNANSKGCGICEKEGGEEGIEVSWFSSQSIGAHAKCFNMIKATESDLIKTIDGLFKNEIENEDYGNTNTAHEKAIDAVKIACGFETILSYFEKNGVQTLTHLFNSVGVEAAKKYAASVQKY